MIYPFAIRTKFTFDSSNTAYDNNVIYNQVFLRVQEQYFNDKSKAANTPIFLNEVLEALGLSRTHAGQIYGWHSGSKIMFNAKSDGNVIHLDFNIDGSVLDDLQ